MTGSKQTSHFPTEGDNFAMLGPWRMLSGASWHGYRLAAEAAHIRAATVAEDQLAARRATRRADQLQQRGPHPVPLLPQPTGQRPRR